MMARSDSIRIVEVGPRDGLQNIKEHVPTSTKLELIERLEKSGMSNIELTSLVSPKVIPQLADSKDVLENSRIQEILKSPLRRLPVLVPNLKGLQIAIQNNVREVAVFISATEGFSKANINCSVETGLLRANEVIASASKSKIAVRGYVSCIFADPYEGPTDPAAVLRCTKSLLDAGCYEVSLGDTLGIGSPNNVHNLLTYLMDNGIPLEKLAGHFHDTYGQAVANVWEAYRIGLRVFDSSVGGLGGCPFAPGAKGNVASEDLVYMFNNAGIQTGIDLLKLVETGQWISQKLGKPSSSRAGAAIMAKVSTKPSSTSSSTHPIDTTQRWAHERETDGLLIHRSGVNLRVTLNRPKNGNALTERMIVDLTETIKNAGKDQTISRIAIAANGKFFCTGMNLSKSGTAVGKDDSASDNQFNILTELFEAIDGSPKVTIAFINGPAFGGGVGLAFACDIRLCAEDANFTLSEVKLGLCAATISKYVVREWGVPFSREAMLSARPVSAKELKALGVVSAVTDTPGNMHLALDRFLDELKIASPDASQMSKELVKLGWAHAGSERQVNRIKDIFSKMMSPYSDGAYGVKEFQARRRVDWDTYMQRFQSKSRL